MSDSHKRDGEQVKLDVMTIINIYQNGFKDKLVGDAYFDGYRAALDALHQDIEKVKTEV